LHSASEPRYKSRIQRPDPNAYISNLLAQAKYRQPPSDSTAELLKLRAEVARLRSDSQELARLKTAKNETSEAAAKSWLARLDELKQRLEITPGASIPEFQFLTEEDWLKAAKGELSTEYDYRRAFSALRAAAEGKFAPMMKTAVEKFRKNNQKQFPSDLSQLQPYFEKPVDPAILQRWAILPASTITSLDFGGDVVITQRDAVDDVFDMRYGIGPDGGWGSTDFLSSKTGETMVPVYAAYQIAHGGERPDDPSELLPYVKTPEQQAALQKIIQRKTGEK